MKGTFDDAQAIVKEAFQDVKFREKVSLFDIEFYEKQAHEHYLVGSSLKKIKDACIQVGYLSLTKLESMFVSSSTV